MLNRRRGMKEGKGFIIKTGLGKKGFLQISFTWLFAIIIGAMILFFAIYMSVKLIKTEKSVSSTETGKEIAVLLNPLETGFGEEKTTLLKIPIESRINNKCESFGNFGEQVISVSEKNKKEWKDTSVGSTLYNKYLFSNKSVQGKDFYLFSKPFEFPFKVADLIFLTSSEESYCFMDSPKEIQEELTSLSQKNLFTENCPEDSIKVCFEEKSGCNVIINENEKSVDKGEGSGIYQGTIRDVFRSASCGSVFEDN